MPSAQAAGEHLKGVAQLRLKLAAASGRKHIQDQHGQEWCGDDEEQRWQGASKNEANEASRDSAAGDEQQEVCLSHLQARLLQRCTTAEPRILADVLFHEGGSRVRDPGEQCGAVDHSRPSSGNGNFPPGTLERNEE